MRLMGSHLRTVSTLLLLACAARQVPAPTPTPASTQQQPQLPDPARVDAERAAQRVEEINRTATDCEIEKSSACCLGFVARPRFDGSPRPPPRSYLNDPDCSEGPPGHRPRGPVLCYGQRVPTGVSRASDGGCELRFE